MIAATARRRTDSSPKVFSLKNIAWLPPELIAESAIWSPTAMMLMQRLTRLPAERAVPIVDPHHHPGVADPLIGAVFVLRGDAALGDRPVEVGDKVVDVAGEFSR